MIFAGWVVGVISVISSPDTHRASWQLPECWNPPDTTPVIPVIVLGAGSAEPHRSSSTPSVAPLTSEVDGEGLVEGGQRDRALLPLPPRSSRPSLYSSSLDSYPPSSPPGLRPRPALRRRRQGLSVDDRGSTRATRSSSCCPRSFRKVSSSASSCRNAMRRG